VKSLKYLFSRPPRDVEWQNAVISKLDALAASQEHLRKEVADHVAEARPTSRGRWLAVTVLSITFLFISISVNATIISPIFQNRATTASNQSQEASNQVAKDLQPVENIVNKYGAKYLIAHPNDSLLSDMKAAEAPAKQLSQDNAQASHFDTEYFFSEYLGQTLLAVSSACFGAVAGWLLIPALVGGRPCRSSTQQ
jgi:hypothetical protein